MPAVAVGAVVDVQGRGAVLGAFRGGELSFVAARIAVLALAGLVTQGGCAFLVVALAARVLAGEQVIHAAEGCSKLRLLLLPRRALLAAHGRLPSRNTFCTDAKNHAIMQAIGAPLSRAALVND